MEPDGGGTRNVREAALTYHLVKTRRSSSVSTYACVHALNTFSSCRAGASASFEASVLHSTESSMASTYTKTAENGGISVALSSSTSWGASASVSCFGSASVDSSTNQVIVKQLSMTDNGAY